MKMKKTIVNYVPNIRFFQNAASPLELRSTPILLLAAGVLGDCLGSLRDGVLGELSRQEKSDRGLDLPGGDGGPLVVVSQSAGLCSNPLEQIIDKGVHDTHGLGGDTSVGVDLLQHLVDVDSVGLLPPCLLLLLLISLHNGLGSFAR